MNLINRALIAAALAIPALAAAPQVAISGTHPDGNGGAVCKGIGSCLVLELDCKGTYTDATQPDGTVYGKCDQVKAVAPRTQMRLKAG